jgi:hypothetical protein
MKTGLKSIAQFALFLAAAAAPALAENPPMARTTLSRTTLPKTTLIVLADWHTQIEFWPLLESALQQEAASGLAPINGSIEIVPAGRGTPGPVFPSRIEIELLGRCDALWNQNAPQHQGPLGWVIGSSGKVSPVIYVDCAQIDQAIWPETQRLPRDQRLQATSEAIAHVILHEWTHIETQSDTHAKHGLMQPELSIPELTTPEGIKPMR